MNKSSKFLVLVLVVVGALAFVRTNGLTAPQHGVGGHDVAVAKLQQTYAAFAGEWKGQLEYRDYRNDKRVTLPTLLDVSSSKDGASLRFSYTYDDGPGKTVKSTEVVSIDLASNKFVYASDDGKEKTEYGVEGLKELSEKRQGTLVLKGTGEENDKPVEVRKTITVADKTLTILKETKLGGEPFRFRNQYTFTRVEKPAGD